MIAREPHLADADLARPDALRVSPRWVVRTVPDEAVYLLSELETIVLEQDAVRAIFDAVDGRRSQDDIAAFLMEHRPDLDVASLYFHLDELETKGYLQRADVSPEVPAGTIGVLAEWGVAAADISERLAGRVDIGFIGGSHTREDAEAVQAALQESGLGCSLVHESEAVLAAAGDAECDLLVVIVDDYANRALGAIDQARRAVNRRWLLARPGLTTTWVGPIFSPGTSACWHCLEFRIVGNREIERYLQIRTGIDPLRPAAPAAGVTRAFSAGLIGTTVLKALVVDRDDATEDDVTILTLAPDTGERGIHHVIKRPQCAVCGTPEPLDALHPPVDIASSPRLLDNDSGTRSVTPEATYERFKHQVSPITGAVSALTRIDDVDNPAMHVYASGHNFAMRGHDLRQFRAGLRNKSSGKGMTDAQARVSALGEAMERFQGLYTGEERRRPGTFEELGASAIHPNDIMLWSQAQLDNRDWWNALDHRFVLVPERFSTDLVVDWSPVWSLTDQDVRWIPTGQLYYAAPRHHNRMLFVACSNGAAAGNTREEAILQGLFEIVERDSVALWWYNRAKRPPVPVEEFGDENLDRICAVYEGLDRPVAFIDLTSDLGIPAYGAISARRNGVTEDILMGFGAHLDPRIAALRAVAEVTQFYPAVANHHPDGSGQYDYDDRESQQWWSTATRESDPYLVPDAAAPRVPYADCVGPVTDIGAAVRSVQGLLEAAGHQVLVLDQTRADVGFPTVKVIVPGLRHFWARYAPGRLYDVPVRLGWLDQPTPEDSLNPTLMFL